VRAPLRITRHRISHTFGSNARQTDVLPSIPCLLDQPCSPRVSIIIPVLNEATLIAPFLRHLRKRAPEAELIVVDGGSTDETTALASSWCDRLVVSKRGRGEQLNSGASAARGSVLWFLHVDSRVPEGCLDEIRTALEARDAVGGYFRIQLRKHTPFIGSTRDHLHPWEGPAKINVAFAQGKSLLFGALRVTQFRMAISATHPTRYGARPLTGGVGCNRELWAAA
jgi:glycosyltransferase involved in cell wall biosynthesis